MSSKAVNKFSPNQIDQAIQDIQQEMNPTWRRRNKLPELTPEELRSYKGKIDQYRILRDSIAFPDVSGPTLKLPLQTTRQESTKIIPGW